MFRLRARTTPDGASERREAGMRLVSRKLLFWLNYILTYLMEALILISALGKSYYSNRYLTHFKLRKLNLSLSPLTVHRWTCISYLRLEHQLSA
jgi:hypothetical protein